jgi:hypothetical protein
MSLIAPRLAPGIGTAMARVASRFYFFSILLVASTIYLPHKVTPNTYGLIALAFLAFGTLVFLSYFPWDEHEPRVFTLFYTITSSLLTAILIYCTGGLQSGYHLLFFLIIFFHTLTI